MYLATLVFLLALACLTSFGAAYYLFTTRFDSTLPNADALPANVSQALEADNYDYDLCPPVNPNDKYLAYLPHSGFHNQRIALENALTLSRLLNRTLIVLPARLGRKALRYADYDSLKSYVSLSGKEGLKHCSRIPSHVTIPPECSDYWEYTLLSWEWLVDLRDIKSQQPIIFRWNLSDAWIDDCLGVSRSDTFTLKDSSRYHYRFLDTVTDASPDSHKFQEDIYLPTLVDIPQRLLQMGTLFGSSRLRLLNDGNLALRRKVRTSMTIVNPVLLHVSDLVHDKLGGYYLGAHIRLGDGQFSVHGNENVREIWWRLVHETLGFSIEDTLSLESSFAATEVSPSPPFHSIQRPIQSQVVSPSMISPNIRCRAILHSLPHLTKLNVPLYISTDVKDPLQDPTLALFLRTFPCSFFFTDFAQEATILDQLVNNYDGLPLKPFTVPFVDAIIIGKASHVVGTPGSTFSRFVEDHLWPKYHGLPIKERG
ncbi:hypothetical protein K435DRAFT_789191 [Dendrothele bispora CBS 962.96]|uniref:CigA protein n=1 Tax=Dendrothele bispora (strain CBS 962.96) TaxID=1314807 RepID=A0A4S8MUQ3_DENBC|nr:hypothetical protein K435DRAFT_789191 [Dendrothele bispora CBS 962.96]